MPLRALFNPAAYSSANFSTAKICFKTTFPGFTTASSSAPLSRTRGHRVTHGGNRRHQGKRGHSTAASLPGGISKERLLAPWESLFGAPPSSTSAAPGTCCPTHAPVPTPFNQDSAYWRVHRPSRTYEQAVTDKFHEIEQLYRGNVEYVKRMSEQSPGLLEGLAFQGQKPPFMIVDCSDSRVNEGGIFDSEPGTMFTAGNIANMFDEGDISSNAVLTYAVGTLNVKHVVIMGHYGCGGVAASMAPLPAGYEEKWLSKQPPISSATNGLARANGEPVDLAVQRWILPIRRIYESSGRTEIRAHRERIVGLIESGKWTREEVATALMAAPVNVTEAVPGDGEKSITGKLAEEGVRGVHLHDPAFRALVEENVKANVWRVSRSHVIRDHHTAYAASLEQNGGKSDMNPVYVHGWVYDLENGVVSDLGVSSGPPGWVPPPGGVRGFPPSLSRARG